MDQQSKTSQVRNVFTVTDEIAIPSQIQNSRFRKKYILVWHMNDNSGLNIKGTLAHEAPLFQFRDSFSM